MNLLENQNFKLLEVGNTNYPVFFLNKDKGKSLDIFTKENSEKLLLVELKITSYQLKDFAENFKIRHYVNFDTVFINEIEACEILSNINVSDLYKDIHLKSVMFQILNSWALNDLDNNPQKHNFIKSLVAPKNINHFTYLAFNDGYKTNILQGSLEKIINWCLPYIIDHYEENKKLYDKFFHSCFSGLQIKTYQKIINKTKNKEKEILFSYLNNYKENFEKRKEKILIEMSIFNDFLIYNNNENLDQNIFSVNFNHMKTYLKQLDIEVISFSSKELTTKISFAVNKKENQEEIIKEYVKIAHYDNFLDLFHTRLEKDLLDKKLNSEEIKDNKKNVFKL